MVQVALDPEIESKEIRSQLAEYNIQESSQASWILTRSKEDNLTVVDVDGRRLEIDFDRQVADYKRTHRGSGEPLAKALGFKKDVRNVVDLTAGLGIDAVFLAQIGFRVTSLERNPLLIFLLHAAQKKTQRPEIKNIKWIYSDAKSFLQNYQLPARTSCYFDPMYPEKKKAALPRQEMVVFRQMVGADVDARDTLRVALEKEFTRTVVKRPLKGEVLVDKPNFQLTSKLIRYDVYLPHMSQEVME